MYQLLLYCNVHVLHKSVVIVYHEQATLGIIESVDSISRDGMDTPIYVIHYKHPNISKRVIL